MGIGDFYSILMRLSNHGRLTLMATVRVLTELTATVFGGTLSARQAFSFLTVEDSSRSRTMNGILGS